MICTSRPEPYCFDFWLGRILSVVHESDDGSGDVQQAGVEVLVLYVHTAQRSLEPKVLVADIFFLSSLRTGPRVTHF